MREVYVIQIRIVIKQSFVNFKIVLMMKVYAFKNQTLINVKSLGQYVDVMGKLIKVTVIEKLQEFQEPILESVSMKFLVTVAFITRIAQKIFSASSFRNCLELFHRGLAQNVPEQIRAATLIAQNLERIQFAW